MADEKRENEENIDSSGDLSRRDFVAMSMAAGIAAAAGSASAAEAVTETNVEIKTPDGTCDAAYIHPVAGSHPGLLIWTDQQKEVNKAKKIGTQGYCMGGPLVVRTAAAVSNRTN